MVGSEQHSYSSKISLPAGGKKEVIICYSASICITLQSNSKKLFFFLKRVYSKDKIKVIFKFVCLTIIWIEFSFSENLSTGPVMFLRNFREACAKLSQI